MMNIQKEPYTINQLSRLELIVENFNSKVDKHAVGYLARYIIGCSLY